MAQLSMETPIPTGGRAFLRMLIWPAAFYIAWVFLSNEQYKILGDPAAVWLFTLLTDWMHLHGFEKAMRLFTAFWEVTAAILVLVPFTRIYGAALALCVMTGALFFHLVSPLGVDPAHDGGHLFASACAVWLLSAYILLIKRADIVALWQPSNAFATLLSLGSSPRTESDPVSRPNGDELFEAHLADPEASYPATTPMKGTTMSKFDTYKNSFPNAKLARAANGVLEIALHTNGDKLVFNGHTHEQFVDLFYQIGNDRDNRVVILTGSGDAFMDSMNPEGFDFFSPMGYNKIFNEGRKILTNILDVEVPMIAAINGPVLLHSEYVLLCDIVLAAPHAVFQDKPHFDFGIVPGDGIHVLWPEVIGSVRGRYFVLTRQEIDAQMALDYGVVNEIVPSAQLLDRARTIANGLAALPPLTAQYTRMAMTRKLRRLLEDDLGYGLALEGISAAEVARASAAK